jgi:hypothetical protein
MCNIFKKGDTINFRKKLVAEIGEEVVKDMESRTALTNLAGRQEASDLELVIAKYKALVDKLLT